MCVREFLRRCWRVKSDYGVVCVWRVGIIWKVVGILIYGLIFYVGWVFVRGKDGVWDDCDIVCFEWLWNIVFFFGCGCIWKVWLSYDWMWIEWNDSWNWVCGCLVCGFCKCEFVWVDFWGYC